MNAHAFFARVVGTAVSYESNSRHVIDAAREFVRDVGGSVDADSATDALQVRIIVRPSVGASARARLEYFSGDDGRLFIHSSGVVGSVEPLRRESIAYVDESILLEPPALVELLEALTFAIIACFDRHPVHAAAIEHGGSALLLAGPSGAGKSTLAWLAHRSGHNVLGEDRVWVQLQPELRVWGAAARVRLRTSADEKEAVVLERDAKHTARSTDRATVCILDRGTRARLDRLAPSDVRDGLIAQLAPGFDRFPARQPAVLAALTQPGGWRLTLSSNPEDAMPFIRTMLEDAC